MQQNTSRHGPFFVFLISGKAKDEKWQWRHSFFSFHMQWEWKIRKTKYEPYFVFCLCEIRKTVQDVVFRFPYTGRNEKNELTVHTRTVFRFFLFRVECDTRNTVFTKIRFSHTAFLFSYWRHTWKMRYTFRFSFFAFDRNAKNGTENRVSIFVQHTENEKRPFFVFRISYDVRKTK